MQQLQHKAVVLLPVFKALGRQRTTSVFTSSCRLVLQNNSIRHSSTGASNDRNSQHGIESTSDASVNLNSATSAQSVSTGSLPSATESQRLQASKKLSKLMDGLLSRASIAGQHINEYTGTDYTAIDALRKDISKQEEVVKNCATGCNAARAQQQDAHNNQSNASREIVGLLERKSSWSPVDLERYMALVRSDHVNEQAVQAAKDNLKAMEQKLDEARAMLERLERKRYHEEQIWSDTIRRNSTWVTFGLMGVNIILLLAQITIFEPHRRKKIAADVQDMLDKRERNSTAAIDEDALASLVSASHVAGGPERHQSRG
ncbi:uncharacterized protein K489DRAFT_402567 [Dissoconium aciculare CBS 342.82]|uniref:Sensitive to high expression protein 9, mitochondrial n=1 Tax=Dissoconium aciculare CBS 342.82 TaxID=1314786 RepID=A0A6J3M112_9PEZI|nr:uncharacterized protein K489DRAFT_402567 [Dissoconium aciculare CBS 342.82]KAF1821711.1 hypothetical protein K489DRAFT_402567 [Dissoconium aciculare CBS 342.82]